ncbi:MAG: hypothetical protein HY810_05210 [Candidatus Omnitrophica bacterium]|nr:hypothetical protein [Candidatus Omnitrophota bacterium]
MARKNKENPGYDSERETRVLLENMNKNIGLISEQHSEVIRKLDEHDEKFERLGSELETVKMAVMENSRQIKQLDTKVNNLDTKVNSLDTKVDNLDTKVDNLNTRLVRVEKKLDTNIDNHEKRIIKIEEKVGI